ncbi:MAG TPA: hypothetical protein VMT00_00340 [Thermoanaerobaculia bacterium]|nr:hypothetical protein [Thermoanaerobaculia bacterium]
MRELWVVDSSPLIALGRIGRLDLFSSLASDVVVPKAVAVELRRAEDEASLALSASWIRIERTEIHHLVAAWGLGAGETAVLSFAKLNEGYVAVVGERWCAARLNTG